MSEINRHLQEMSRQLKDSRENIDRLATEISKLAQVENKREEYIDALQQIIDKLKDPTLEIVDDRVYNSYINVTEEIIQTESGPVVLAVGLVSNLRLRRK